VHRGLAFPRRGNQEREPGETEKGEEKLDRVLGW